MSAHHPGAEQTWRLMQRLLHCPGDEGTLLSIRPAHDGNRGRTNLRLRRLGSGQHLLDSKSVKVG